MFWADKILRDRKGEERINDSWTPSGIVHMGGLKGPVIHDTLFKIIKEQGGDVKFTFGFDDLDPIDGLPENLKESLGQYMGIPICNAPSPDGSGSFGDYYSGMMRSLFEKLNIHAEIYLASDYYRKGIYDDAIKLVLDNAEKVRKAYFEMYGKEIPKDWYPLQVICPECGKLGTTKVIGWDGNEVSFECAKDLVKWAEGCSTTGKISPFKGNAKMPFKVEWAAKWWTFKVTIEGAGKDHASAGGTYDVARKIIKDVFNQEPPLALPYEFFLYNGKKMSSSKGLGLTGAELLGVLPPEVARFLMIKTPPNQAVEFNPNGTQIIPRLYDDYQACAKKHKENVGDDEARAFELSQVGEINYPAETRFSTLAQWVQMPNMSEELEKADIKDWAEYAKVWIEKYAPEDEKYLIQEKLPESINNLSNEQRSYLSALSDKIEEKMSADDLQLLIYNQSKESNITSKDAFAALYISFIGKDHGPKAGWLLASLDKKFVKNRLFEAAQGR